MAQKKLVKHLRVGDVFYRVHTDGSISQNHIVEISKKNKYGIHYDNYSHSEHAYKDILNNTSFNLEYSDIGYVSMNDAIVAAKTILHTRILVASTEIAKLTTFINNIVKQLNEYPKM